MIALCQQGKSAREVAEAVGLAKSTIQEIVRKTEVVAWAQTGSGSSGASEAAATARGCRSEYMLNRREVIADKRLDAAEKSADLAAHEDEPRKRQALMLSPDASMRAHANLTKNDVSIREQERMEKAVSTLDVLRDQLTQRGPIPFEAGVIEE